MQPTIIKRTQVQVEARPVACSSGQKSARLLEDDGKVHAIELRCACGETTVFELDYAPDQTDGKAQS